MRLMDLSTSFKISNMKRFGIHLKSLVRDTSKRVILKASQTLRRRRREFGIVVFKIFDFWTMTIVVDTAGITSFL